MITSKIIENIQGEFYKGRHWFSQKVFDNINIENIFF